MQRSKTTTQEYVDKIANSLVLYNRIKMSHINIFKSGIADWMVLNQEYNDIAHIKILNWCRHLNQEINFSDLENALKNSIIIQRPKLEHVDMAGENAAKWDGLKAFSDKVDFIAECIENECKDLSQATSWHIREWMKSTNRFTDEQITKVKR